MIIEKRYRITLTAKTPIHVGSRKDPLSGADSPVIQLGAKVAIPGSSLKGILRHTLENLLIDRYYSVQESRWDSEAVGYEPCIPVARDRDLSRDEALLVSKGKYKSPGCHYPCPHGEKHAICPICYLLGAQGLQGFLRVPFLYSDITPQRLQSVRIDRATLTAAKGPMFSYDLVPQDTKFDGDLFAITQNTALKWELGRPRPLKDNTLGDLWLEKEKMSPEQLINQYVLTPLRAIKVIGGYKSKGFGDVEIKVEEVS